MTRFRLALLAFLALAAAVIIPMVRRFGAIDQCLDAGGAWDYAAQRCVAAANPEATTLVVKTVRTSFDLSLPTIFAVAMAFIVAYALIRRARRSSSGETSSN